MGRPSGTLSAAARSLASLDFRRWRLSPRPFNYTALKRTCGILIAISRNAAPIANKPNISPSDLSQRPNPPNADPPSDGSPQSRAKNPKKKLKNRPFKNKKHGGTAVALRALDRELCSLDQFPVLRGKKRTKMSKTNRIKHYRVATW